MTFAIKQGDGNHSWTLVLAPALLAVGLFDAWRVGRAAALLVTRVEVAVLWISLASEVWATFQAERSRGISPREAGRRYITFGLIAILAFDLIAPMR